MSEMSEQDWKLAYQIAQSLSKVDSNAVEKLQVHLRTRNAVESSRNLLDSLTANSSKFLQLTLEQRKTRGVSFIRRERMASDYQKLAQSLGVLFDGGLDVKRQSLILGWVARLMKYDRVSGDLGESAGRGSGDRRRQVSSLSSAITSSDSVASKASAPLINQGAKNPQQPPRSETKRETITLITPAKNGKAQVRTGKGEEISCANLPSYPPAKAGDVCRADVARENGKAIKCVFKGRA